MSTSNHPIIVPSDFDVEDAFSSTHSTDYFSASPRNTSPDPLDDLSKYLLASLAISLFHDDPYIKVMQAYNATSNESPIPLPRAPITPQTVFPPSLVLPLSPIFDPQDFFLPKEILPPSTPMTQVAIKKLVSNSVVAALEAQAATMENTDNTNRNTR
nr:hypothetical protein [Tanacetum cinerariifolium]